MDYEQASAIGDVGERRVADLLRAEAPRLGYQMLDNLLLVDDRTTAQLDHVLVDRFGIVVVETKNYHALIRGKSDDQKWTACYSGNGRRRERFLNPLRQNDRHREMLHRVLGACGRRFPSEYVQSLVAFAGGNIAHLKLDDVDEMRVVPGPQVVDYMRARCGNFQPNPGALDAEQVADLVSVLQSVNQANNPDVVALHAENVERATTRFGGQFRRRPARGPSMPSTPYGPRLAYSQDSRYPDGSQRVSTRGSLRRRRAFVDLVSVVLVLALASWLLFAGGSGLLGTLLVSSFTRQVAADSAVTAPLPSQPPVAYDVGLARQQLQDADPRVYSELTDASRPQLSTTNGLPTYTWQYVEKTSRSSASVYAISITLDASGHMVGVTGGK